MKPRILIKAALFALYLITAYLVVYLELLGGGSTNVTVSIILISLGLGIAAQVIFNWHNTKSDGVVFKYAMGTVGAMLLPLLLFGLESLICIIIALPVMALMLLFGVVGVSMINTAINDRTLCVPLLALPFALPIMDVTSLTSVDRYAVTTTIDLPLSIDAAMDLTRDVPMIHDHERPWTVTHNILRAPRPVSAEIIDGVRYATWEKGVKFQEVIHDDTGATTLSWGFVFPDIRLLRPIDYSVAPTGPEVFMDKGSYHFAPLSDGTTRVTLTTEYRLNTPMNWYYAAWGRLFLNDFHMAVLGVLAHRAET